MRSESAPSSATAAKQHDAGTPASVSRDAITNGTITHRPLHGTGGDELNDENRGAQPARSQANPCSLVSHSEAQTILGAPVVTAVEAPLGPTCIYRAAGASNFVTVSVSSSDFAKVASLLGKRKRVEVGGHAGYCGNSGQPMTFVSLAHGKVLNISASCTIGARFAARALQRLHLQ